VGDSCINKEEWAANSENKKAFTDNLNDQSSKWKCFIIWLFVIATKEIL
jgi:hypothetical protein